MKVLVIEDEQPAAKRLTRLIQELRPHAEIVRCIDSVEDAVEFFESKEKIDLAFMDIQLADGLSFDIFLKTEVIVPVIFTTAYDHYAVKAFKVNSVDYLLKPIELKDLEQAISKFETIYLAKENAVPDFAQLIETLKTPKDPYKKRFLVKTAGRLSFVNVDDIAYFFSDDGNTFLVTSDNDRFLLDGILEEIEAQLNPLTFFRINRKMLTALSSIRKIESHFNNRYLLQLSPPFEEEVIVSRQRSGEFKNWLDS